MSSESFAGLGTLMTGALTAVDVQNLARDEGRALQVQYGVNDVPRLSHPADRMQLRQELVRFRRMHRRLDDTRRDSVDPDLARGVLNCERPRCGIEATLGHCGKACRHAAVGMIDKGGRDLHDVP